MSDSLIDDDEIEEMPIEEEMSIKDRNALGENKYCGTVESGDELETATNIIFELNEASDEEDIDRAPLYSSSENEQEGEITGNGSLEVPPTPSLHSHRLSFIMEEKLHVFVKNVRKRTTDVREEVIKEISSDDEDAKSVAAEEEPPSLADLLGFIEPEDEVKHWGLVLFKESIDTQSNLYLCWLCILVFSFLYNLFVVPLRSSYPYQNEHNLKYWLFGDYVCDIVYLIDTLYIKPRLSFMENGMPVHDFRYTSVNYINSNAFLIDILSIIPTDLSYFLMSKPISLVRVNRFLKYPSYVKLFTILDTSFSSPYAVRIVKTFNYMFLLIHYNSCIYYKISAYEGFGQIAYRMKDKWYVNKWAYNNNQGNAYIRCFYFTAAVATSTGNNPVPTNVIEYIYMTCSWMMGVFVFALMLGQIRDIVSNARRNKENFRVNMDLALVVCKNLNLKPETQAKVKAWFTYAWEQQKTLDERRLLDKLPLKLQADLALSVHYNTLMKVSLFKNCERALLRELVLKFRAVIFLPGDLVCNKGDVGKEMYIINNGILEVCGGDCNEIVFTELAVGAVFGEISLMAIGGNNRRTATIRSKGYSTLFVLSKEDLNDAIKDYPEAHRLLKKKARKMLKKDQKAKSKNIKENKRRLEEKCKITTEIKTPKMFSTIANAVRPGSSISRRMYEVLENDKFEKKHRHWSTIQSDTDMELSIVHD
uniref:Cyclic nucleotide-binding domain-containing protein n=1 Tax=Rhabditophanes sp. KR3021 TaxID=114890 RepID=A0AC35TJH8_9BILA